MAESCLITGGSGFIGRHLVQLLIERGPYEKIYVLDKQPTTVQDRAVRFIRHDLCDSAPLNLPQDCETCFHLAAVCKEPGYPWDQYFRTNHVGTVNLCEAFGRSNIRKVIFTSTMMVYRAGDERMQESSLISPDTAYGISKVLAEQTLIRWQAAQVGRRLRIIRPGVVFGPSEQGNFTRLYNALRHGYFAYVGRRTTVKGCIYVKDLVRCLEFLTHDSGAEMIYNAVFPEEITIEEICTTMSQVFGLRRWVPTIPYHLALVGAGLFELVELLGIRSPVHRRRIQKLYFSTNLSAARLRSAGFCFDHNLRSSLEDWKRSSPAGQLA